MLLLRGSGVCCWFFKTLHASKIKQQSEPCAVISDWSQVSPAQKTSETQFEELSGAPWEGQGCLTVMLCSSSPSAPSKAGQWGYCSFIRRQIFITYCKSAAAAPQRLCICTSGNTLGAHFISTLLCLVFVTFKRPGHRSERGAGWMWLVCKAQGGGRQRAPCAHPIRVEMSSCSSLCLRNWSKEMLHGGEAAAPGK